MRFKKFIYSVLLLLFTLVLIADLGLWFLVPEAGAETQETSGASFTAPEGMTFPGGGSLPEGMTFPTDGTVPEGMTFPSNSDGTLPEGMTVPDGGSFPSGGFSFGGSFPSSGDGSEGGGSSGGGFPGGMSFPGSSEGSGDRSERPSRPGRSSEESETEAAATAETPETETETGWRSTVQSWLSTAKSWFSAAKNWLSARVTELQAYLPLAELQSLKARVSPYRLYILIGSALGMALCIVRLAFINRKIRRQQEADPLSQRRVALWPAFFLLLGALSLVVFLFPVNEEEEAEDGAVTNQKVITGTVEEKTITSLIQSAGSLAEQEAVSLTIPASVTVSSVCVHNGDTVTAGQIIGKADLTSVMKAIASVHEVLADIDGQLQKAHESKGDTSLTAPVAGTVKVVYAEVGEKAMDVMADHGALMLLSLDGRMAVQIPAADGLVIGSAVTVTLADGTELLGEVAFLEEGVATVTVVDRGYAIGEQVSVKDEDGSLLGSGPLYVHKALNITGYLGTIDRIYRAEGATVYANQPLIGLTDTADLADYTALLQQRSEYEAELKTLFELYQTGYIHAPCDGVVDGLSDELTYASLPDVVAGLTVRRLSATDPANADPTAFYNFLAAVVGKDGSTVELDRGGEVQVTDYAALPSPSGSMAGSYVFSGSEPLYLLSGGWSQTTADSILTGDILLFTFDQNGSLVWVIVQHTSASATPTPTPTPTPAPTPTPTPDGSARPDGSPRPGESAQPSGSASPSGGGGRPSGGGGGGSISFRVPSGGGTGGGSGTTKKVAYTIEEQELCTVTPQEKMLITVSIDELDVLALSLGQEAELYLDALPSVGFTAAVTKIDPEGENSGGNTKYSVTLALDRTAQLYPGMNGTVCFPRKEGQKVPAVPLAALEEDGARTLVYTAYSEETDELLSPVEVQTGVSDGTDVEIVSGLSLGDTFYYRYADSISYVTE